MSILTALLVVFLLSVFLHWLWAAVRGSLKPKPAPAPESPRCPRCGHDRTGNFCGRCGAATTAGVEWLKLKAQAKRIAERMNQASDFPTQPQYQTGIYYQQNLINNYQREQIEFRRYVELERARGEYPIQHLDRELTYKGIPIQYIEKLDDMPAEDRRFYWWH